MNRIFYAFFILLAFIPLIQLSTPGQDPLLIPSNIFLWCVAAFFIGSATFLVYRNNTIILPGYTAWLLALPAGLVFSGLITGTERPVDWVFRIGAILTGIAFFFALFQFRQSRRQCDNAIYAILIALIFNGTIGYLQLMPGRPFIGLIEHPERPAALGVFMQANLQASMMVTGLLLAIYQITSPGFRNRHAAIQLIPALAIFICSSSVMATGSRIGLISMAITLPILFLARLPLLKKQWRWGCTIAVLVALGCGTGVAMSDGFFRAYSKLERLAEEGQDARPHIYRISWSLYTDKPIAGHGIGSFQSVFHQRAGEYMAARGGEPLIGHSRFSHPHNELLFWAIEGGSIALIGITLAACAVLIQLWRQGRQRGLALLALLTPITLHTQVELPFYSSTYHWLVFLFLAFLAFQYRRRSIEMRLSRAASVLIPSAGLAAIAGFLLIMYSTYNASRHLTLYMLKQDPDIRHLLAAQETLYFNELSNLLMYKAMLYTDLTNGTQRWTEGYIEWAESYLQQQPETSTFSDLALAYRHLGMAEKADNTLTRGLFIYPQHPDILNTKNIIDQNRPAVPGQLIDR